MAEQPEAQETRSAYLLDGRRVTIADLIGAGLLTPGDALRLNDLAWARPTRQSSPRTARCRSKVGRNSGHRQRLRKWLPICPPWPVGTRGRSRLLAGHSTRCARTARSGGGRHRGRGRNGRWRHGQSAGPVRVAEGARLHADAKDSVDSIGPRLAGAVGCQGARREGQSADRGGPGYLAQLPDGDDRCQGAPDHGVARRRGHR